MTQLGIITENLLDEWVRGHAKEAQGTIVELLWRLVAASCPRPQGRRFPLGDSIGQPGPDGFLDVTLGLDPFVPDGKSYWEIGTGTKPGTKATSDYRERTKQTPPAIRHESTFIFVTPLSGTKDWPYTWKVSSQGKWLADRRARKDWKDVRVVDGTQLVEWLKLFPAVTQWLAQKMNLASAVVQTPEQRWRELETIGEPPLLPPGLFLVNRDAACEKLQGVFSGEIMQLRLDTYFPGKIGDFVAAYVATLPDEQKAEVSGRSLILLNSDDWNSALNIVTDNHIFILNFDLEATDSTITRLLEKSRRRGHAVIYEGSPGGLPHPESIEIRNPKSYQVQDVLQKAGYREERARTLAQKSNGNIDSLVRCIQNLSLTPQWAQGTEAADLAIAELLGGWKEEVEADIGVASQLVKKEYGEWIGTLREISLRPGTPLVHRAGHWKFVNRYEGWFALGPQLFDEHLDRFEEIAVRVLREQDPKFDLSPEERYAASIYGKVSRYSSALKKGVSESLALIGSFPSALTSCSKEKRETTAILAIRHMLADIDWKLWCSLNDYLPLLAEAAPEEFLSAIEEIINSKSELIAQIFAQEGKGVFGNNYMTGVLWALETLGWSANYLTRVTLILGELATKDPGGNWSNRPLNSLTTIFLPWHPQTCAPIQVRKSAISALLSEAPNAGWDLLLNLLPSKHQMTMGARRPAWRELIPEDWPDSVTRKEYWEQIEAYTELTISLAQKDNDQMSQLIEHLDDLPPDSRSEILSFLGSEKFLENLDDIKRLSLWTRLLQLVTTHRKFKDAEWALDSDTVELISGIAEKLQPRELIYVYQRLFTERAVELFEERTDFKQAFQKLEEKRQMAVTEIYKSGGIVKLLELVKIADSPWRVGIASGCVIESEVDERILPDLFDSDPMSLEQFAGGFITGRYYTHGWKWVDSLGMASWTESQTGQFFGYLPFVNETWQRVSRFLSKDEAPYWTKAAVNPYQAEENLEYAIRRLVDHGRPNEAIQCLERLIHDNEPVDNELSIRVLQSLVKSPPSTIRNIESHAIVRVIQSLQDNPTVEADKVYGIEWAFLPLLDEFSEGSPRFLENRLSTDPTFFCQIIQIIFKSKKKKNAQADLPRNKNIASNAYQLLHHWKQPPGLQPGGSFIEDVFVKWLSGVKEVCTESGHIDIALEMVGHVLYYSPPDPDGLWIHRAIASAMNAKDVKHMREGFVLESINSRGVHGVDPSGKPERDLAKKAREKAEQLEIHGYSRFANSLRELALHYDREAERVIEEADED